MKERLPVLTLLSRKTPLVVIGGMGAFALPRCLGGHPNMKTGTSLYEIQNAVQF